MRWCWTPSAFFHSHFFNCEAFLFHSVMNSVTYHLMQLRKAPSVIFLFVVGFPIVVDKHEWKKIDSFDMLNRSTGPTNNLFNLFDLQRHPFLGNVNDKLRKRKHQIDFNGFLNISSALKICTIARHTNRNDIQKVVVVVCTKHSFHQFLTQNYFQRSTRKSCQDLHNCCRCADVISTLRKTCAS